MLPVTAMCVLAGSVVVSRQSSAAQANSVDGGVIGLSQIVALRDGLHAQQTVEAFNVRLEQSGITRDTATAAVGFDWAAQVAPARAKADRAIAQLGQDSPVSESALQQLYTEIDGGLISPAAAVQRLAGYVLVSDEAATSAVDQLEIDAHQTALVATLESLRAVSVMLDVGAPQAIDLSAIWYPSPGATAQTTATVLARFAAQDVAYQEATAKLRALGVKDVVAGLGHIEADPQAQLFDDAVKAALLGQTPMASGAPLDVATVAAAFRGFVVRDGLLDALVGSATKAVRDEARRLASAAQGSLIAWAVGSAVLALTSIGVALRLARSISRPLKDLADYAHAVNDGEFDAEPSPRRSRGPHETRDAFGVFTELVANLRLLDAKANALAQCDFDDPVLSKPLPGRLGRSLESSVAVLSGSIVERDRLQTHLAHQATHDSLTGVFNRPAAMTGIQAAINRAARSGAPTALLFVDLNEFKAVNDSHGHEAGDEVLRQVATRMAVGLRSGDFVARLGGDEFVVVTEGIADVDEATEVARRIIKSVGQPIEVGTQQITIGAAIGVALSLDGPDDPLRLLARADAAMYRAKHHDRSAIEIFDASLQQQMIEREDIE
ncbi:MAG: hypothetical protein QOG39_1345, partial [Acidimicrobiaceae bacterium]